MTFASWLLASRRAALFGLSAALFAFGFAIDGTSEVGHHAGLIFGGILIGRSLRD